MSPGSCYLHLSFKSSVFWYCFPICVMEMMSLACVFRGLEETTEAALLSLEEHSAACSALLLKALPELPTSTSGSFSSSFLQIISYTHALLGSAVRPFSVGGAFWRREGAWSSLTDYKQVHHGARSLSCTTHFLSVLLPQVQALSLLQGLYSSPDPTPSSLTLCLSQELVPFWLVSSLICFSRIKMYFFVISIISCLWFGGNTLQDTGLTPGGAESRFRLVAYRASLLPASFSLQPCFCFIYSASQELI